MDTGDTPLPLLPAAPEPRNETADTEEDINGGDGTEEPGGEWESEEEEEREGDEEYYTEEEDEEGEWEEEETGTLKIVLTKHLAMLNLECQVLNWRLY